MKIKGYAVMIVILVILSYFLYYFPIQRYLAEKTLKEYMSVQGTTNEIIDSKRIFKDYKMGGYIISIVYQDDPEYTYEYIYMPLKSDLKSSMLCIIYDEKNVDVTITNKEVKYPPIHE